MVVAVVPVVPQVLEGSLGKNCGSDLKLKEALTFKIGLGLTSLVVHGLRFEGLEYRLLRLR